MRTTTKISLVALAALAIGCAVAQDDTGAPGSSAGGSAPASGGATGGGGSHTGGKTASGGASSGGASSGGASSGGASSGGASSGGASSGGTGGTGGAAGCACNKNPWCDPGCNCDATCVSQCPCNLGAGCDTGCACDEQCYQPAGPTTTGCTPLTLPASTAGSIDANDPSFNSLPYDEYCVTLQAGQKLSVETGPTANAIDDTFVTLTDANGKLLTYDDDGAGGFFSKLEYTAPADGSYVIGVFGLNSLVTGDYSLDVSSQ